MKIQLPSADQLSTPHYDEFQGMARDFFSDIDPVEALGAISLDDLAEARLHPNDFYVRYLTDPKERETLQGKLGCTYGTRAMLLIVLKAIYINIPGTWLRKLSPEHMWNRSLQ